MLLVWLVKLVRTATAKLISVYLSLPTVTSLPPEEHPEEGRDMRAAREDDGGGLFVLLPLCLHQQITGEAHDLNFLHPVVLKLSLLFSPSSPFIFRYLSPSKCGQRLVSTIVPLSR